MHGVVSHADSTEFALTPTGGETLGIQRVLVIERDLELISAARNALEQRGYEVEIAMTGGTGVEIVTNRRVDVVLMGLDGLEIPGPDLLQRVKESKPGIPILVTGDHLSRHRQSAELCERVAGFLDKPLSGEQFLSELDRVTAPATVPASE